MTEDPLDTLLARARDDTAQPSDALRARVVTDAVRVTAPVRRPFWRGLGGWIGLPGAALLGLWLGAAQPALVFEMMPGLASETALLDDVFGASFELALTE